MAAVGAAVGLGNLWRFPFQTGQNGGAAFVLIYLACVAFIGAPVLIGELAIGRSEGGAAVRSIRRLAVGAGRSPLWAAGGWIGASASILVLPIYSVIAGKIVAFAAMAFAGLLSADRIAAPPLYAGPVGAIAWMSAFLAATVFIVARGLRRGVEAAVSVLMPILFLTLVALSVFALSIGASGEAMAYLFAPRFSEVSPETALAALGQALFSLAVGGAVMITYGAYLAEGERLGRNAAVIAATDTLVALIAGLMIFPIVFAQGLDPAAGMGLIFEALPPVFLSLPAGRLVGGLFFSLAILAALTSSISMLLIAATLGEEEFGWRRAIAIGAFGVFAWIVGAYSAIDENFSHGLDFAVGGVLLPLGALSSALIAGWVAPRPLMRRQLNDFPEGAFRLWRFAVRIAAPAAIAAIFIFGVDAKFDLGLARAIGSLF